ncbi:hypothetical protein H4R20_001140 [Coemansia guatemalensis]|uniref:RanBP2-type domain-containing protein n=1 Tax=Coemansia guatemalensis TaxID=2761395 RepID=A0A9W8I049_9FUNG|nr:hypothetical protein H4R20_001140 [Coemansia guatemalensis]
MATADTTGDQLVDILHDPVKENVCLRVASIPFSTRRRETPAYSRLLAISSQYGYMVAGTPQGLAVFQTRDAQDELFAGSSKGTNTATTLKARKDVDLTSHGQVTHVGVSADEQRVVVCTIGGKILVFSAQSLVGQGSNVPSTTISVGKEVRDMRVNPKEMAALVAVLTLDGELLMVDIDNSSSSSVVKGEARVTAICWSRKGKQIVCGDNKGILTQRTPTDGTAKRTIEPQTSDGEIGEGAAVLAVDWPETHTFFAVYGQIPSDAYVSGSGGGDDEFEDNATAGYVVTRPDKNMPFTWIHVEDPCSSMMCPERYPGFHIASVGEWGSSASDVLVMAGTGSDATMTIGKAATSVAADGSADPQSLTWAEWDIDGRMAAMPLSALDSGDDTFPVGMAVDYTAQRDLPPVAEDGDRVGPVPILWILNTDACLLGYHICNTFEMQRGQRPAAMIEKVKALSSAAEHAKDPSEPAKSPPFAPGIAFGKATSPNAFGKTTSPPNAFSKATSPDAFGGGFGQASPFGKAGSITPIVKAPTSMPTKHVFGSTSKLGGGSSFSGFGGAVKEGGKSIFDTPASGPSIFDAPSKGESPFGVAKPFNAEKKAPAQSSAAAAAGDSTPATTGFGAFASSKSASSTPLSSLSASSFGSALGQSAAAAAPKAAEQAPKPTAPATGFGAFASSKPATSTPFGKPSAPPFGSAWGQAASSSASKAAEPSAATGFGGFSLGAQSSSAEPKSALKSALKPQPSVFGSLSGTSPFSATKASPEQHTQHVSFALPDDTAQVSADEQRQREAEAAEAEEQRKEQLRQEELQRELELKTQQLIDQQYIDTCNSFDGKLKALAQSLRKTDAAISQARAAQLPPIRIDPAVEEMAGLNSRMQAMSIDDSELWNRTASVLLEALDVSRLELRGSQRSLARQMSAHLKAETRREEVARMLNAVSPTATDSGLNPLQREYQRRLKNSFALISKRAADVEQVVNAEAERHEAKRNEAPPQLRAPSFDSIQRTLHNVQKTLAQKNLELDELAQLLDGMDFGRPSESANKKPRRPPISLHALPDTKPAPRTAAEGVPWSPADLPFNVPQTRRGYGLRDEDLLVGSKPLTPPATAQPAENTPLSSTSPWFSHTQVRELVPRSSKIHRRPSLVSDGSGADRDDAISAVPTSVFSSAAAYLQTRRQRAVVRDVLTRPSRIAAVIRSPDSSIKGAMSINQPATVPKAVPMPNLNRYVEAFGKLRVADEPEPEPEPMPEPMLHRQKSDQVADTVDVGNRLPSKEWTCSTCELQNPDSASACQICEAARPGVSQSAFAPPKASAPAASFGGGFQLAGGLSFGAALSAATPQSATSSPFGSSSKPRIDMSGSKGLSFGSFVPPGGAAPAPTTTSDLGAKSQGTEWTCEICELKNPDSASACQICEAARPGVSQSAVAPPKASAPTAPVGGSGFQLSGGLSFGAALSAATPQSTSSSLFGGSPKPQIDMSGSKGLSFTSFVPPGGAASAPTVTTTSISDTESEGVEWVCDTCELKNIASAAKCIVCDAEKPANPRLASSITSTFEPRAAPEDTAANSYSSDEFSGDESEESASDSGSSVGSSEDSESSLAEPTDELSESDAASDHGDAHLDLPVDKQMTAARPGGKETDNAPVSEDDKSSKSLPGNKEAATASADGVSIAEGDNVNVAVSDVKESDAASADGVSNAEDDKSHASLPGDKEVANVSADGSPIAEDDNINTPMPGDKEPDAVSADKEADTVLISGQKESDAALSEDKKAPAASTGEKVESKPDSDSDNASPAHADSAVPGTGLVVEETNDEAASKDNGADLAQSETEASNVEIAPGEPVGKDSGSDKQAKEHKSYSAALKEAISDRVDSDSADSAPVDAETETTTEKHATVSDTEQQAISKYEGSESDVASIVDGSELSEDGDAIAAAGPTAASEDHDSDGFVHVSQQASQTEDREDDARSSTPASIRENSEEISETSGRGVSPDGSDVPHKSDDTDTDASAKVPSEEAVESKSAEAGDNAEHKEGAQKEQLPEPAKDASIGDQDDVDKFDIDRLQILFGRASVEYIVEQALDASYSGDSESESESANGAPEIASPVEVPPSGELDAPESVATDKPEPAAKDESESAALEEPEPVVAEEPEPVVADEPDVDAQTPAADLSSEDVLHNDRLPMPAALEKSLTGSSGDFVMLSHPDENINDLTSGSASSSGDDKSDDNFSMGDIAAGIDHASAGATADLQPSEASESPAIGSRSDSDYDSDDSLPKAEPPKVAAIATAAPLSKDSNDAKSFFKAGRLGNFGGKSAFSVQKAPGSSQPTAFAASSPSSIPAFGSKLGKPVFGVGSMSSFGAKSAAGGSQAQTASFANLSKKMPTGFSQHSAGSQNQFAVLRESSGSPDSMVSNDSNSSAFLQGGSRGAFGRGFGSPKPRDLGKPVDSSDPIRSIIQGDDSDAAVSDSDSD